MGVPFKKIARKDPRKADAVAKFYPRLGTLGDNATLDDIAYVMKEKSSLTLGDIQSVLTNFVEAMITTLYSGQSVNIKNFGVFSLSARSAGVLDVKECTAKNIKAVKINFRPSSTVRPDIAATRAGQKIDFYDLEALVNKGMHFTREALSCVSPFLRPMTGLGDRYAAFGERGSGRAGGSRRERLPSAGPVVRGAPFQTQGPH